MIIGACVRGQVQQHPDNRRVASSFVVRFAVRVNTKSELGGRCSIGISIIAMLLAESLTNLIPRKLVNVPSFVNCRLHFVKFVTSVCRSDSFA